MMTGGFGEILLCVSVSLCLWVYVLLDMYVFVVSRVRKSRWERKEGEEAFM